MNKKVQRWFQFGSEIDFSSVSTIAAICGNPVSEIRSTFSVAINHMESSI